MILPAGELGASAWLDCSDLARPFRHARQREALIFGGAGALLGAVGILVLVVLGRIGGLPIVALALFAIAGIFLIIGGWDMVGARYLAGMRTDSVGLHLRYLNRPESVAAWSGMELEFVSLDMPRFPYLGTDGTEMDASWMIWLKGRCVGDLPAILVEETSSGARLHGMKVRRSQGPWHGFPLARMVRIEET